MAHLDAIEAQPEATPDTLFWWRRDQPTEAESHASLIERLGTLTDRVGPALRTEELPGNSLRANAARYRVIGAGRLVAPAAHDRIDPDLRDAIRLERRKAAVALATGLAGTALAAGAAAYAMAMEEFLALGFTAAGMAVTSLALYHAARWMRLMRSDAVPKFI